MTNEHAFPNRQEVVIPEPTLRRIPMYVQYLRLKADEDLESISSTTMAADLSLSPIQIRKDLEAIGAVGRPRTGYDVSSLVEHMEEFLGYNNVKEAVLVGAGHLGQALMAYEGFEDFGLRIVAAFDADPALSGKTVGGKQIFPAGRIDEMVRRLRIRIGILTVPAAHAQDACDALVDGGALAIWNFTPHHVSVPEGVILQNENMATSLAVLSNRLEAAMLKNRMKEHKHDQR